MKSGERSLSVVLCTGMTPGDGIRPIPALAHYATFFALHCVYRKPSFRFSYSYRDYRLLFHTILSSTVHLVSEPVEQAGLTRAEKARTGRTTR